MRKIETQGNKHAELKIAGVAVSDKRAARRAYPAERIHLVDKAGQVVGIIRFWSASVVDITIDPRLRLQIQRKTFWPQKQTDDNNDAQIMSRFELEKARIQADHEGVSDDQAIAEILGLTESWELQNFKKGEVGDYDAWIFPFAER